MKKQYTLLLAMLLGLLGFTASANTYTFILSGEGSLVYGTQVTGGGYNFYGTVEQGTHEVEVEKYTQLYFKAADGYEIVSVFDVGLNEAKKPINTEGIYNQYVGSANKTFEVKLQPVGGSEQPTGESATFNVTGSGSVSLCSMDGTLIQELELGEKTYENLQITTGTYKLVPGENTAIVSASEIGYPTTGVIKSDGSCEIFLYVPDPKWAVTIKEKAANKTVSMDVLSDNEIVIINPRWEAVKTLSKGETQFELSDEYYYFVANGVTDKTLFEVKADGTGNPLTVSNSYSFNNNVTGVYVTLNTASAADKYTFEVKAPAVKTIVLDLLSDADVVLWDRSNWTKVQTLVKGENTVEIPSAQYNVVANGVTNADDFIVKDPNGNELWVSASQQFDSSVSGVSIMFNSANAPEKYTIEVKEQVVVPQTKDFVVNLTGKATLKYQNGSATWEEYPLTEGANNVSLPATVTAANLLATDGYVLESCVNKEGTALSKSTSWGMGGIQVFSLPVASLSESYTLVTVDPNAPTVKTIVLDLLSDADVFVQCQSPWGKVKTLQKGENTVEIPNSAYYIVANGVTDKANLIVKANGEGDPLNVISSAPFDNGDAGVSVLFYSANAPEKYTIEVKQTEVKTNDFVVNLTGKAKLIYVENSTKNEIPLQEGANEVKVPTTATNILIVATDGYVLESCVNKEGDAIEKKMSYAVMADAFTIPYANPSESYTVVTVDPNAPVVTTFTINVDDPANVQVMNQSYKSLSLVAGKNEFDPTEITSLRISQAYSAEKPIFSCTLDGTPLEFYQNCYSVNPTAAGQVIDIVTTWPDVDYTIELVYTDAQNVWTRATIGDQYDASKQTDVEIVDNKVSVPAGSTLNLYCDNFNDYTFNGNDGYGNPVVVGPDGEKIAVYPSPSYQVMPNVSFSVTKSGTLTTDAAGKLQIPVKITITGNPENVKVSYAPEGSYAYQYETITGLTTGENYFTMDSGCEMMVTPLNEAELTMTYKVSGDAQLEDGVPYQGSLCTGVITGLGAEVNITVTGGTGPVYDAEFVVNIDGFGGTLQYRPLSGGYKVFKTLEPGENFVGITEDENRNLLGGQLYVVPAEGWDFTECTDQDGNKINISSYPFPSCIEINTFNPKTEYNFKGISTDKDVTLTFEGPADYWTKILVNEQEVTPENNTLTIRYNDLVKLYNTDYAAWVTTSIIDPTTGRSVYVDPSTVNEWPILAFNIKGDWTVTVDAHRFENYDVTVNVTTANLIRLRHNDKNITLKNGANTIQVAEYDTAPFYVQLRDADKGYIVAVQSQANADVELIPAEFDGGTYEIAGFTGNGGVINIDVEASAEALVYTDKATNLTDCKENTIALTEGYNHVALHYADAPFAFEGEPSLYVNYEALEGALTLRANDICKAYYEAAQPLTVTFTVAPADENMPEADAAFANVTRDYITNVADVTVPFTVMPGTFISFMTDTAEGLNYEVTVNGEKVEGVENVYTTTITADTEIKLVYDNSGSGIVTISRDQLDLNAVYFDLAGRRIDARNIAAGIYIRVAGNTATKIAVK